MPSPILFFIFIIVIDLILKSNKDKKKIQESRRSTIPRPMQDLKRILEDELEREKQRQRDTQVRPKTPQGVNKKVRPMAQFIEKEEPREEVDWTINTRTEDVERKKPEMSKVKKLNEKEEFKKNLLNGIVFSQILSEPKSVQNQRRSL